MLVEQALKLRSCFIGVCCNKSLLCLFDETKNAMGVSPEEELKRVSFGYVAHSTHVASFRGSGSD